ncbi:MAG: hypothetical protein ACK40L_09330, partial [Hydrogenophaga sp.]
AGCGDHWPLCNGEVIPRSPSMETFIEYSHRITSGLALLAVLGLFVWARLTGAGGKVADGGELAKRAIEIGVAFVPGAPFYAANPDPATLRLSFATVGVDKIEEGIGRLAQAL